MDHNDIEMTDLEGEQRELAETVGITAYRKLVQVYAGQFVYISKAETVLLKKTKSANPSRIHRAKCPGAGNQIQSVRKHDPGADLHGKETHRQRANRRADAPVVVLFSDCYSLFFTAHLLYGIV